MLIMRVTAIMVVVTWEIQPKVQLRNSGISVLKVYSKLMLLKKTYEMKMPGINVVMKSEAAITLKRKFWMVLRFLV